MTRTTGLARYSAAAATATLLAGLAAAPAIARPDPGEPAPQEPSGALSNPIEPVGFGCPPSETGAYDKMQDYVRTLIWWYYHPDWRVD
ncbi:MAG: hypothetical protein ACRD0W_07620 [Acidimicrobiales bacterium]